MTRATVLILSYKAHILIGVCSSFVGLSSEQPIIVDVGPLQGEPAQARRIPMPSKNPQMVSPDAVESDDSPVFHLGGLLIQSILEQSDKLLEQFDKGK